MRFQAGLTVLERVQRRTQSVVDGVPDLLDGVVVGALQQQGHRLWVLAVLDERVLVLALAIISSSNPSSWQETYQDVLVDGARPAEHGRRQVVDGVHRLAADRQLQTLHVAALGATQRQDAVLREQVQGRRVDALKRLVKYGKRAVDRVNVMAEQRSYTSRTTGAGLGPRPPGPGPP